MIREQDNRFLSFSSSILFASRSSLPIRILSWKIELKLQIYTTKHNSKGRIGQLYDTFLLEKKYTLLN